MGRDGKMLETYGLCFEYWDERISNRYCDYTSVKLASLNYQFSNIETETISLTGMYGKVLPITIK